jgi:uncharacterized protein
MATIQAHRPGTIDWLSLSTPDRGRAAVFYSDLFDWGFTTYETGAGPMLGADVRGRDAAGIFEPRPTIGDLTLPAVWTVYIRVDDLDEALVSLLALGGRIIERPTEIIELGRSAIVADPTGAVFALSTLHPDVGLKVQDEPGALTWCEVLTRDPATAVAFYSALLGWAAHHDPASGYTTFTLDDAPVAGMMAVPAELPAEAPAHWLPYFCVTDCEKSARWAEELGGTVHHPPQRVGIGVFAVIEDPHGATFCLLEYAAPELGDMGRR